MFFTRAWILWLFLFLGSIGMAKAQEALTPVGNWLTYDDATGELASQVEIRPVNDTLSGRVIRIYKHSTPDQQRCTKCTDYRKNQPILGMEILHGAHKVEGENVWEGGKILDPEAGHEYTLRLTPVEGGDKLKVRGSFGFFYRTQLWIRTFPLQNPASP